MSDASWGVIGAVVGASISAVATYLAQRYSQRQSELMTDCRSAIKDLKRFRELDDIWAEELSKLKPGTSPEGERRRVHGMLDDKILQYGERARINKLLDRLGNGDLRFCPSPTIFLVTSRRGAGAFHQPAFRSKVVST